MLCVADCHYGAEWIVRGLRGEILNRYNPEVFGERMDDLLAQVREMAGNVEAHLAELGMLHQKLEQLLLLESENMHFKTQILNP